MAKIILDDRYGPRVHLAVNGDFEELTTGSTITVSTAVLEAVDNAGLDYERVWRSTNDTLAALTLDTDDVDEDAAVDTVVGAVQGAKTGSTLTVSDDAGGLFALDGSNVVVADALDFETAASHDIDITESNDEIEELSKTTTITITVNDIAE